MILGDIYIEKRRSVKKWRIRRAAAAQDWGETANRRDLGSSDTVASKCARALLLFDRGERAFSPEIT